MGRLGGGQHSLESPTPAQGSETFAWVQRPGQAWLTDRGRVHVSPSPPQERQPRDWAGAQTELLLEVPLPLGEPGPQGSEVWACAPVFIMGIMRELRLPSDGCWSSRTQGPGTSRHSLPPSLYLKTWGRQRAAGRQGWGGAGRAAPAPTLSHTGPGPAASRGLAQGHSSVKSLSMSM